MRWTVFGIASFRLHSHTENADGQPEFGRILVPDFLATAEQSVAIQFSGGISKLPEILHDDMEFLQEALPEAVGIIIDADKADAAAAYANLREEIAKMKIPFALPDNHKDIHAGSPRVGVFVLPNNDIQGTLEHVMIECAQGSYPQLLEIANDVVAKVQANFDRDINWLAKPERDEFRAPAGPNKLCASVVAAVMKPTYAIGNSYRQNRWITPGTLGLPHIATLSDFLQRLLADDGAPLPVEPPAAS